MNELVKDLYVVGILMVLLFAVMLVFSILSYNKNKEVDGQVFDAKKFWSGIWRRVQYVVCAFLLIIVADGIKMLVAYMEWGAEIEVMIEGVTAMALFVIIVGSIGSYFLKDLILFKDIIWPREDGLLIGEVVDFEVNDLNVGKEHESNDGDDIIEDESNDESTPYEPYTPDSNEAIEEEQTEAKG